ncbi:Arabinogalactan endo-1,4-beta-galactosidase [Phytophthora cinnamomi]|uniref:Arabinogalactan endo-1,4-beta-galactosidase n=1 Tax=Phytophthora cinnamomi TaxID=4785 RepID=UPI00355A127D|nr:Arabinogalactan endo-1,4-beta-galactosidase [Phytophthora cinnamomi]
MFTRKTLLGVAMCMAAVIYGVQALTRGHDLSSVRLMEKKLGVVWYNNAGKEEAIEDILRAGGMDAVRLRIWTSGDYDLNYTLALAQRFSKAGFKIYLDMHFSDKWVDPRHQETPAAWDNSSLETLADDLQAYVTSTLQAFTDGGVDLDIVSQHFLHVLD